MKEYSLGIDTSNYKTSVALVDKEANILCDERILLKVPMGQRGLRQQEALFQHVNNLPELIEKAMNAACDGRIVRVSASSRPRNVKGSYMPCFNGGVSAASIIASTLGTTPTFFSHQQGHIEAVRRYTRLRNTDRFGAFHFSGGTTEALLFENGELTQIGGTLDISLGQVLDRVGVYLGMAFPAGEELDSYALKGEAEEIKLPKPKLQDGYVNLSGLETHLRRLIEEKEGNIEETFISNLSSSIFRVFTGVIDEMMKYMAEEHKVDAFLFVGGVSSSKYLSSYYGDNPLVVMGNPSLASDNAVGIALLGGDEVWR